MLVPIIIGFAAWIAVSTGAAMLLFAYLTGRVQRSTALLADAGALLAGAAIAGSSALGVLPFGSLAVLFGSFLMLAAGFNGLLACKVRKA